MTDWATLDGSGGAARLPRVALDSVAVRALTNLAGLRRIRGWRWFLPALALYPAGHYLAPVATQLAWMVALLLWLLINIRTPGMLLAASGVAYNLVAIAANGGRMPFIGHARPDALHMAADASVRLGVLADRWLIPWPAPSLISVGDIVLIAGIVWLVSACIWSAAGAGSDQRSAAASAAVSSARTV